MKKVTVTFKRAPGGAFKVVKAVNTTKYIPGAVFSQDDIERVMRSTPPTTDIILT